MYVARYTNTPEEDIKRGWSGGLGGGMTWDTISEWAADMAIGPDFEDDIEECQQRWINTWGDKYEDWDTFVEDYLEELASEHDLRFDEFMGAYRLAHHDGLSCWMLEAETLEGAIQEARALDENSKISWSGFGYATVGRVTLAAKAKDAEDAPLYIFQCDDVTQEV